VAECESSFDPKAINVNRDGSRDRGVFQWNEKAFPLVTDKMAFDIEKATTLFCGEVKQRNLKWWNSSRVCWSRKVATNIIEKYI